MALTKTGTDGIKDDAITAAKLDVNSVQNAAIATGAVATDKLAANAVTTTKIADEAVTLAKLPHGTSSNDGKFLRANNGADPSFETVSSVGGATGVDFNDNVKVRLGTGNDLHIYHSGTHSYIDSNTGSFYIRDGGSEKVRINGYGTAITGGLLFGSNTAAANALDDYEEGEYTPTITLGSGSVSLQSSYDRVRYTKIGRQVSLTGQLVFNAHSNGGGTLNIGLPFTNGNGSDRSEYVLYAGAGYFNQTNSNAPNNHVNPIAFSLSANTSHATVHALHPNYDTTIGNWVGSGSDIWFNLTYFTDA